MDCTPNRRRILLGGAHLALWGFVPGAAIGGARDPRLLVVVLRGGLDGLALAAPVGDPDYERLRGKLALPTTGPGAGLPLDGFFALNGSMPYLHGLYLKRQALIAHAIATPYRARSHFDGQDVLESGLPGVGPTRDGWLNRALAGLPHGGVTEPAKGLAMGAVVPLIIRGAAPVLSWTPKANGLPLRDDTLGRLMALYGETDPALAKALAEGVEIDRVAGTQTAPATKAAAGPPMPAATPVPRPLQGFIETAEAAAKFMTSPGGPRIGALSFDGWDTHANEGAAGGTLANRLAGLDAALKAYADGVGAGWKDTVVVIITEFGRTARTNGTLGTDHGTATVAVLVGGGVKGGRILTDWPGLADKSLFEGRDVAPTRDLRALLKGVLKDHLGLPDGMLATTVFPDSDRFAPVSDLFA